MTSRTLPLWIVALLALAAAILWLNPPGKSPSPPPAPPEARPSTHPSLSDLATSPDWLAINGFQSTISRGDFLLQMDGVFTVSPEWRDWFEVGEQEVKV